MLREDAHFGGAEMLIRTNGFFGQRNILSEKWKIVEKNTEIDYNGTHEEEGR